MPSARDAQLRFVNYCVQLAERYRTDPACAAAELDNIIRAAEFCIELEEWPSLTQLTGAINPHLLRRARWGDYIKYNSSLLANDLEHVEERVIRLKQLIEIEELRGNYLEALRLGVELVKLEEHGNVSSTMEALKKLSKLTETQGDYDSSIQYLIRALSLARQHEIRRDEVDLSFDLAALHKKKLDYTRALVWCEAALQSAHFIGYSSKEIAILSLWATLLEAQDQLRDALRFYEAAISAARRIGDKAHETSITEEIIRVRGLIRLEEAKKMNVFISYNHQDRSFAERLANDLKAAGLPVWWDQWEIKVGQSIIQRVSEGISSSAYLVVVLSPNSVESDWVKREVGSALMRQLSAEKNITILTALAADCEVPVLLREIKWADFREEYETGLGALLNALVGYA